MLFYASLSLSFHLSPSLACSEVFPKGRKYRTSIKPGRLSFYSSLNICKGRGEKTVEGVQSIFCLCLNIWPIWCVLFVGICWWTPHVITCWRPHLIDHIMPLMWIGRYPNVQVQMGVLGPDFEACMEFGLGLDLVPDYPNLTHICTSSSSKFYSQALYIFTNLYPSKSETNQKTWISIPAQVNSYWTRERNY